MIGCNDVCAMALWVIYWISYDEWISDSHWCERMSWLDILSMNGFNTARWLWSHGDWLMCDRLLTSDLKCKSL